MIIKIIHQRQTYTPICSILRIACAEYSTYHDEIIGIMVRDAKQLVVNKDYRFYANSRTFAYSSVLSQKGGRVVEDMDPEHLKQSDYQFLLEFFESL